MTASRWLSALKKYTIKLVQECSTPKLYFPLLFLFWSASFHLASENNHEASPCCVSHFSKYQPTGKGTRELDLPDGGGSCTQITKLKLHCIFIENNAFLAFTKCSPVFILKTLSFARNSVLWSKWGRFYHRSNLALRFLHWLLIALNLDFGWTFQNSVLPQIFQIYKSHSIILYPRFFLNLKSLKPNQLRILEWFPFDTFSASMCKTGCPLVKQFTNPQCTLWLLLLRRKKKKSYYNELPWWFPLWLRK